MWNVGKFGDMRPYAVLSPVEVGGVRIGLATLHNEEDLARKDIRAGEDVIVLRAGDVIPQVVSPAPHVVERKRRPPRPRPPARCPFCNTKTVKPKDAVFTKCPNPRLSRRASGSCSSTSSRGARWTSMGSGRSRSRCSSSAGSSTTAGDFYRLTAEQLIELEGFGELSVKNLLEAIEASKQRPFARVLFALGIEEVGEVTARNLAQRFRDIDSLLSASPRGDRADTPGVGEKMAASITEQLDDERMRALIDDLRDGRSALRRGGPGPVGGAAGRTGRSCSRAPCRTGRAKRPPSASWPPAGA